MAKGKQQNGKKGKNGQGKKQNGNGKTAKRLKGNWKMAKRGPNWTNWSLMSVAVSVVFIGPHLCACLPRCQVATLLSRDNIDLGDN